MIILHLIGFVWATFAPYHTESYEFYFPVKVKILNTQDDVYNPFGTDTFDYDNDLETNPFEEELELENHSRKLNPHNQPVIDNIWSIIEV